MQAQRENMTPARKLSAGEVVVTLLNLCLALVFGLYSPKLLGGNSSRECYFLGIPFLIFSLSLTLANTLLLARQRKIAFWFQLLASVAMAVPVGFFLWDVLFTVDDDGDAAAGLFYFGFVWLFTLLLSGFAWRFKRMDESE
jgi:hypothetical protein